GEEVSPAPAGIDSLRSQSVQLAAPVVEPRSGGGMPPPTIKTRKKTPQYKFISFYNISDTAGLAHQKQVYIKNIKHHHKKKKKN
ncbi:hypothetical protein, partial [Enterobacter intestinihominis]